MKSDSKKTAREVPGTRKSRNEESAKKTYHRPQLLIYGDIREITQAIGQNAMPDGGVTLDDMSKI